MISFNILSIYSTVERTKVLESSRRFPFLCFDCGQASTNSLKDDPGTPEECNLFVGDLARNLTEEKLEKAFQHHGRVSISALSSVEVGDQPRVDPNLHDLLLVPRACSVSCAGFVGHN